VRRVYVSQDYCPVARSLDLLGGRWTILVMRDLLRGTVRFSDLEASLKGISPNLLAARLKLLEDRGMVERSFYSDHPPRAEYRLTEKGREFGKVVRALYDWGSKYEPRSASSARRGPVKEGREPATTKSTTPPAR
jgi:DNA-binding HxlR family transcriptional regulator